MFKNSDLPPSEDTETIIGSTVKVEGDFVGKGNIVVEGEVAGSLKTDGEVRVGVRAIIRANISAGSAIVAGTVHGNVLVTDRLDLTESAVVDGDITAKSISMSPGAIFNGTCTMEDSSKQVSAGTAHKNNQQDVDDIEDDEE